MPASAFWSKDFAAACLALLPDDPECHQCFNDTLTELLPRDAASPYRALVTAHLPSAGRSAALIASFTHQTLVYKNWSVLEALREVVLYRKEELGLPSVALTAAVADVTRAQGRFNSLMFAWDFISKTIPHDVLPILALMTQLLWEDYGQRHGHFHRYTCPAAALVWLDSVINTKHGRESVVDIEGFCSRTRLNKSDSIVVSKDAVLDLAKVAASMAEGWESTDGWERAPEERLRCQHTLNTKLDSLAKPREFMSLIDLVDCQLKTGHCRQAFLKRCKGTKPVQLTTKPKRNSEATNKASTPVEATLTSKRKPEMDPNDEGNKKTKADSSDDEVEFVGIQQATQQPASVKAFPASVMPSTPVRQPPSGSMRPIFIASPGHVSILPKPPAHVQQLQLARPSAQQPVQQQQSQQRNPVPQPVVEKPAKQQLSQKENPAPQSAAKQPLPQPQVPFPVPAGQQKNSAPQPPVKQQQPQRKNPAPQPFVKQAVQQRQPQEQRPLPLPSVKQQQPSAQRPVLMTAAAQLFPAKLPAQRQLAQESNQTPHVEDEEDRRESATLLYQALQGGDIATAMEKAVAETRRLDSDGAQASRAVTPPVWTEQIELTEWVMSLLTVSTVRPSSLLQQYLANSTEDPKLNVWGQKLLPILNSAIEGLLLLTVDEGEESDDISQIEVQSGDKVGCVVVQGPMTGDKHLCQAIIALYYHALEAILFVESSRHQVTSHPSIVMNEDFQRGLLACSCWCVTKAIGATQKLRATPELQAIHINDLLHIMGSTPYTFLKSSDSFIRGVTSLTAKGKIGSPLVFTLPKALERDMRLIEGNLLDSLLWASDVGTIQVQGSLPSVIEGLHQSTKSGDTILWPPESLLPNLREEGDKRDMTKGKKFPAAGHTDFSEYQCVNHMVRMLLKASYLRCEGLCKRLAIRKNVQLVPQIWVMFRYILRNHIEGLYDRHVDQWILCCVYAVCKTIKYTPEITFSDIMKAYILERGPVLGDVTCHRIMSFVKMLDHDATIFGTIIEFYNTVFLPLMVDFLTTSESLKECRKSLQA